METIWRWIYHLLTTWQPEASPEAQLERRMVLQFLLTVAVVGVPGLKLTEGVEGLPPPQTVRELRGMLRENQVWGLGSVTIPAASEGRLFCPGMPDGYLREIVLSRTRPEKGRAPKLGVQVVGVHYGPRTFSGNLIPLGARWLPDLTVCNARLPTARVPIFGGEELAVHLVNHLPYPVTVAGGCHPRRSRKPANRGGNTPSIILLVIPSAGEGEGTTRTPQGGRVMLDSYEAVNRIRDGLDPYGEGFSIYSNGGAAELRVLATAHGKVSEVRLNPRRCGVIVKFHRFNGIAVHMDVTKSTWEACVTSALATVSTLLKTKGAP